MLPILQRILAPIRGTFNLVYGRFYSRFRVQDALHLMLLEIRDADGTNHASFHEFLHCSPGLDQIEFRVEDELVLLVPWTPDRYVWLGRSRLLVEFRVKGMKVPD